MRWGPARRPAVAMQAQLVRLGGDVGGVGGGDVDDG